MPKVKSSPCFLTPKRLRPEYPLFVFLPGMDGTGQLLRTQTAGLEVAFDVQCLAIPHDELTSWDELTTKVMALIHAELAKNSHRLVYLCGESFGACLAMKLAIASPQLFDRIILINPASAFQHRPWYGWASQLIHLVPPWLFHTGAEGFLQFMAAVGRILPSDLCDLLKTMQSVPAETVCWRLSLVREFDVDERQLCQLTQPVLVIASASDRLLPSLTEAKRLVNTIPNATMVVLPYSGHACLLEADVNLYKIMRSQNFLYSSAKAIGTSP
ncbi:MAG: alpha/beta fold hydrolase [Chroococcidiopsidaceae cyanobacterium CP_BM_RX_35]|nr:alpha/beta fold hydrolase [Chroococcidiopsidaceae cyanobacterium CP_BM_RX_35]